MLNLGAIIFAVFGFLYSVYALYSSLATPSSPVRSPLCKTLRNLCRGLAVAFAACTAVALLALYLMSPFSGPGESVLAWVLAALMTVIAAGTAGFAFRYME